jgi:Nif-specific regulatory protein
MRNEIEDQKEALEELKILNNLVDRICRLRETNHIMNIIISNLIKATDSDQGVIYLLSSEADTSMSTVVRENIADLSKLPKNYCNLLSGWVIKNRDVLLIEDLNDDDRFPELDSENGQFRSIICQPMLVRDEIIGITIIIRSKRRESFNEQHCRLVGILTSQSAHILFNAKILEELAQKNELLEMSQKRLNEENVRLKNEMNLAFGYENIIGKSESMRNILSTVSKYSINDAPILLTGETGTGKDLIAKAIHHNGPRKDKPFIIKNCGIKTETLLESELFGHRKGSFTGAVNDRDGLFKMADGGTIFLDEIGDAPLSTQVAILRVIDTGDFTPIGASRMEHVNVRIISATNKDLKEEIHKGSFREDLFYRLNTFNVHLPPLRERKEDIPLLANYFLNLIKIKMKRKDLSFTPTVIDAFLNYDWPGNIRQLENEIEKAAAVCDMDGPIDLGDISADIMTSTKIKSIAAIHSGYLKDMVEALEKDVIQSTLLKYNGNVTKSSKFLGLTRKGLSDKILRYKIPVKPEKN